MSGKVRVVLVLATLAAAAWGVRAWLAGRPLPPLSEEQAVAEIDAELSGLVMKGLAGEVLLARNGAVILRKAYGLADRASGRSVTVDTGFDIGSLVKPFTAVAILKLESAGKLRRSDRIAHFFPGVPPDKAVISVDELLAHTSGLPDFVDSDSEAVGYDTDPDYRLVSRDEIVKRAMGAKLRFPPGTKTEYSNLGFSLLGAIVEVASGEPYEHFVREAIFRPAGMTRTGYVGPGWRRAELAVGYKGDHAWGTPLDHPWLPDGPSWNLRANGGMLSTVDDLYRWLEALGGTALLTPTEKSAFFDLYLHVNKRGARLVGAAGSNEIFDACYLWYPDEHRALIMLTSSNRWRAEKMVPYFGRTMLRIR